MGGEGSAAAVGVFLQGLRGIDAPVNIGQIALLLLTVYHAVHIRTVFGCILQLLYQNNTTIGLNSFNKFVQRKVIVSMLIGCLNYPVIANNILKLQCKSLKFIMIVNFGENIQQEKEDRSASRDHVHLEKSVLIAPFLTFGHFDAHD